MKKFVSFFLVLSLVFCLSACSGEIRFSEFDDYKPDLQSVVDYSLTYYLENSTTDDDMTFSLSDESWVSEEISGAVQRIEGVGFDSIWVSAQYVVFWRDETKTYGLLYSKSARKVLSSMKNDWYRGMDYNKIEGDWYEIGQLNAI